MELIFADRIEDVLAAALPTMPTPSSPPDGDGLAGRTAGTLVGSGRAGASQRDSPA
jgi:hypothetical protein